MLVYYAFCYTLLLVHFCTLFLYAFCTLLVLPFYYPLLPFAATLVQYHFINLCYTLVRFFTTHFTTHWYYTYLVHFALALALAHTFPTFFSTLCTTLLYICTTHICIQ
jgi:hypothetical protein